MFEYTFPSIYLTSVYSGASYDANTPFNRCKSTHRVRACGVNLRGVAGASTERIGRPLQTAIDLNILGVIGPCIYDGTTDNQVGYKAGHSTGLCD